MVMITGKQVLPVLAELNSGFGGVHPRVSTAERGRFEPGNELGPALASVLNPANNELNQLLALYVSTIPRGFQEALRSIVYYALSSEPRVLLNFSWAPAYDFELTIWEMVEKEPAYSGMSIALKGRYPDDGTRFAAS